MANQTLNKEAEVDKKSVESADLNDYLREDSDASSLNFENKVEIKLTLANMDDDKKFENNNNVSSD